MKEQLLKHTGILCLLIFMLSFFALGCSAKSASVAEPQETAAPQLTAEPQVFEFSLASNTTPVPTPEPTATPEPEYTSITIGAVGDIMVMPSQITGALDEATGAYDFMRSFVGVKAMFSSVDLMCGNLEGAIAGAEIGYSNGRTDSEGRIKFNAPDEFAFNLKDAGFDCLTTANNHAGDCDAQGVINTIDTLRSAGLLQTGTFKSKEERLPIITEINGIKLGILATTEVINGSSNMSRDEKNAMFSRLQNFEEIEADIAACKALGAEFILMFAHWDEEYENRPQKATRAYAEQLLEAGVDAIIGAHPHVVQPIEYVTVTRPDGSEHTGFVAWSLGNFLANMSGECNYGLYVQLTIGKHPDGTVKLDDAVYMPTYCFAEDITFESQADGKTVVKPIHQLVPALEDGTKIVAFDPLDEKELEQAARARSHVIRICGTDVVPVMEDTCWIN